MPRATPTLSRPVALTDDRIGQAQSAFQLGVQQQAEGDQRAAQMSFRRALVLQPDLAEAWSNLGLLLEGDGLRDEAAACYQRALRSDASLYAVHLNLTRWGGDSRP